MYRLYWSDCARDRNLGDQLGPLILDHYGVSYERSDAADANLITCGSVIDALPHYGWDGTILGSGTLREQTTRDLSKANVLAVRGTRTIERCSLPKRTRVGDLGLLAPKLIRRDYLAEPAGTAVVPHYADSELADRFPQHPEVSLTGGMPDEVIAQIAIRKRIITSSLHALVVADTLGVPHMWVPYEELAGGTHKFHDYATGLGYDGITPNRWRLSDRKLIRNAQKRLETAIRKL